MRKINAYGWGWNLLILWQVSNTQAFRITGSTLFTPSTLFIIIIIIIIIIIRAVIAQSV
jgi:hypothetical protein